MRFVVLFLGFVLALFIAISVAIAPLQAQGEEWIAKIKANSNHLEYLREAIVKEDRVELKKRSVMIIDCFLREISRI